VGKQAALQLREFALDRSVLAPKLLDLLVKW
jgi:hypothetical protein